MEQLLLIFNSLLFLFVGYFFGRQYHDPQIKQKVIKQIKQLPVKAGIIEYPSQADIDYRESGEAKVDEAREKLFRENFKP